MLLFQKRFHVGLVEGSITLTFRQWDTPRVRPGGRYRCHPIGVVEVDDLRRIRVGEISEEDSRRAGFKSRCDLLSYLGQMKGELLDEGREVFRVALHYGGDGDRVETAMQTDLSVEDVADIRARLQKLDAAGDKPWTRRTLKLIESNPRVAASKLAAKVREETQPFKARVVKLKKLGLTQSFEVGYEISPRGRVYLEKAGGRRKR